MTFAEAAMIMMSGGGANVQPLTVTQNGTYNAADYGCDGFQPVLVNVPAGGDPRIDIIKNARELARAEFANGWTLRAKFSDDNSVNMTNINPINSNGHPYQYNSGLLIWGCYYKNDEFMFAANNSSGFATSCLGDYYLNYEKNELYKSSDEIYTITDVNSFEIFGSAFPPTATISVNFNIKRVSHSYDYDGNVTSEYESISEGYSASTPRLSEMGYSGYCKVISRGDWQTYLNDMVDFRMNSIAT